jgi:hypothetical protein
LGFSMGYTDMLVPQHIRDPSLSLSLFALPLAKSGLGAVKHVSARFPSPFPCPQPQASTPGCIANKH